MGSIVSCVDTRSHPRFKKENCVVFDRFQEVQIGAKSNLNNQKYVTANVYRLACHLKSGKTEVPVVSIELWANSPVGSTISVRLNDGETEPLKYHYVFMVLAWISIIVLNIFYVFGVDFWKSEVKYCE